MHGCAQHDISEAFRVPGVGIEPRRCSRAGNLEAAGRRERRQWLWREELLDREAQQTRDALGNGEYLCLAG